MSKGMRQYTVWDDPRRTVAMTLLRTYGEYYVTTNSNLTPDEKAMYPGKHLPGEIEFNYSVYPHAGDWREGDVMTETYDFRTPIRAIQGPAKEGELPARQFFFKIEPEGKVMLSSLCQSEERRRAGESFSESGTPPASRSTRKIKTMLSFKSAIQKTRLR